MSSTLSIIILTYNEESMLPACLASLAGLSARVFVVDSGSTDRTVEIAKQAGCEVVYHAFENYAIQRNWAFDNLDIQSEWILSLDADESLTPELRESIDAVMRNSNEQISAYLMTRRTVFMGRWIKHGGQYPAYHLRLGRQGRIRCEDRLYDQHFVAEGRTEKLRGDLVDQIGCSIERWIDRHNRWSSMEAHELSEPVAATGGERLQPRIFGSPPAQKRFLREKVYARWPLFLRAFGFWFYAYFLRLGFLDGVPGLIFHTHQRFWFRFLTDAKIYERRLSNTCGDTAVNTETPPPPDQKQR